MLPLKRRVRRSQGDQPDEFNTGSSSVEALEKSVVSRQLSLLRFRNSFPAFGFDAKLQILDSTPEILKLRWENHGFAATLEANLKDYTCNIDATDETGKVAYSFR